MDIYSANKDRSVRSWAPELDENAREQALRSARSPAVAGDIALMPDAHFGMGATVGSVIPTESAIIPAAVGVDIGCGMIATELDLEASALPDSLDPLLHSISRSIPAGFNRHKDATTPAATWMNVNPVPDKSRVPAKPLRKAADQLGTLGGGNHFVEVCLDERERVWAVLHSGSRGIGNVMARGHIAAATSLCKDLDRALDDAVFEDLEQLRIIHGKGTGALRQRVSEVLSNDARVREFRMGGPTEGGAGVTVAVFLG